MKAGELYSLATYLMPTVSKRLFTSFYNLAIEKISRSSRISIVEKSYTDDSYSSIPESLVSIESVSSNTRYTWGILGNVLSIFDENGVSVTEPDGLVIKYWEAIIGSLKTVESCLASTNIHDMLFAMREDSPKAGGDDDEDELKAEILVLEDEENYGLPIISQSIAYHGLAKSTVFFRPGNVIKVSKDATTVYVQDEFFNYSAVDISTHLTGDSPTDRFAGGTGKYYLLSDMWEEQDDGLSEDVQIAGTYLALSNMVDIVGESPKQYEYLYGKFKLLERDIKARYNSANTRNQQLVQVSF